MYNTNNIENRGRVPIKKAMPNKMLPKTRVLPIENGIWIKRETILLRREYK